MMAALGKSEDGNGYLGGGDPSTNLEEEVERISKITNLGDRSRLRDEAISLPEQESLARIPRKISDFGQV